MDSVAGGETMIPRGEFALFRDRHDAGQRLAQKLLPHYKEAENTMVIALPRGGGGGGCDIIPAV